MPVLSHKTISLKLPSYEDSEVVIYEKAPFSVVADLEEGKGNMAVAKAILPRLIVDWNFTDESGEKLDVSLENIMKLPIEDINYLLEQALSHVQSTLKKRTLDA